MAEKPLPEMTERLVFSTNILRPPGGEFRVWREDPRTELEYTFRLSEARFAAFEETLIDNITADWTIPLWHERTRRLTLTGGQTVISVDTGADYRVAGQALIWSGCDSYEVATINAVSSGQITVSALASGYTNAAVMPAHSAFLSAPASLGRWFRGYLDVGMQFQIREHADISATVWQAYNTYEVLNCASAYLSRLRGSIVPNVEYVGQNFGPVVLETFREAHDKIFAVELSGHAWDAKRFLQQIAGRDAPFWVKTWGGQLAVESTSSGASTVAVGITRPAADMVGRHIVIDGQYREITGAVDGASQTLTLDSVLSADVAANAPCSLLSLVRAETDTFEIAHKHDFSSRISFPVSEHRA